MKRNTKPDRCRGRCSVNTVLDLVYNQQSAESDMVHILNWSNGQASVGAPEGAHKTFYWGTTPTSYMCNILQKPIFWLTWDKVWIGTWSNIFTCFKLETSKRTWYSEGSCGVDPMRGGGGGQVSLHGGTTFAVQEPPFFWFRTRRGVWYKISTFKLKENRMQMGEYRDPKWEPHWPQKVPIYTSYIFPGNFLGIYTCTCVFASAPSTTKARKGPKKGNPKKDMVEISSVWNKKGSYTYSTEFTSLWLQQTIYSTWLDAKDEILKYAFISTTGQLIRRSGRCPDRPACCLRVRLTIWHVHLPPLRIPITTTINPRATAQ